MKLNVNWEEFKTQVDQADLDGEVKGAMVKFMEEFAALPEKPITLNPWWMSLCIWWLVEEVCAGEPPKRLQWEMYLGIANRWAADRGDDGKKALRAIEELIPVLTSHFKNDDTAVTLEEINGETVHYTLMLSDTLTEPKTFYVASNAQSLAEANFTKNAWYRGIYAGKALVGFVMLYIDDEKAKYMVWRLMIGEPFHGRGYGRKAMEAVIEHLRANHPNAKELILSYGQGPGSPEGFYKKLGFVPTGEEEFGEVYASLSLR